MLPLGLQAGESVWLTERDASEITHVEGVRNVAGHGQAGEHNDSNERETRRCCCSCAHANIAESSTRTAVQQFQQVCYGDIRYREKEDAWHGRTIGFGGVPGRSVQVSLFHGRR